MKFGYVVLCIFIFAAWALSEGYSMAARLSAARQADVARHVERFSDGDE